MTPEERVAVLRRGVVVLRAIEVARRAALPPPERDNFAQLAAVRDVMGLADRIEMDLDIEGSDLDSVYARDAVLSSVCGLDDEALLDSLEPEVRGREAHLAFREFRALLGRYAAHEFWPPTAWFGIDT